MCRLKRNVRVKQMKDVWGRNEYRDKKERFKLYILFEPKTTQ